MEFGEKIEEARDFIKKRSSIRPVLGIILGTGLSGLANRVEAEDIFFYDEIPCFPRSLEEGGRGKMILGYLGGKEVVVFQERLHRYEGYTLKEVTFPVRLIKSLGGDIFITSNAAGGLNRQFFSGDLMVISDHINLTGDNPLVGPNDHRLGIRFPDMSEPYGNELILMAEETALKENISLKKGIYAGVLGPSLETRAETRFLTMMGADAVGMSTVPEVIAAVHAGMKVLGFSVITNVNDPDRMEPVSIDEIIAVAGGAEFKLIRLVEKVIERIKIEGSIDEVK